MRLLDWLCSFGLSARKSADRFVDTEKPDRFAPDQILRMFLPIDFEQLPLLQCEQRDQSRISVRFDVPAGARGAAIRDEFCRLGRRAEAAAARSPVPAQARFCLASVWSLIRQQAL